MTGINHALTGAAIGAVTSSPFALAAAFISHFFLDWLPHYGSSSENPRQKRKKVLLQIKIETVFFLVLGLWLVYVQASHWVYMAAFMAIMPDLIWLVPYIFRPQAYEDKTAWPKNFNKFHSQIQTKESERYLWAELIWFTCVAPAMIMLTNQ